VQITRKNPGWSVLFAAALALFILPGCGGKKATKSSSSSSSSSTSSSSKSTNGQTVLAGTKSSQSAITAQKGNATKTQSTPKPVPPAATVGSTTVNPPVLSGDIYETWTFAQVDLDGDGELESGDALYDAGTQTLCLWWAESDYLGGDMVSFDGFAWIDNGGAGFILVLQDGSVFGCAEDANSNSAVAGCVACDPQNDCEIVAVAEDYDN
jgi:hypothetical protein